ncbi:hypothetical protein EYC84_001974 [Monilinia fructicola]|uniref:ubiquitinyl hydrolase 1 n=1 Tax=Monilinia fructicola TaxID=38448 RepID=A0A5M9JRB4_MONFR|nr:hypothetical protein EYC84_001974 [Monilinia fructicola]
MYVFTVALRKLRCSPSRIFHLILQPSANSEQQRLLAFKTSSTKKRKLSPQIVPGIETDRGPDIPISSVEGRESQSPTDLPLFDTSLQESHRAESLPPNTIPSHLQTSSTLPPGDYTSSAASSPSAAYAGLSIDSDKGGEFPSNKNRRQFPSEQPFELEQQGKSPRHRSIMSGAEDMPQRSSSPLKRPASELEPDLPLSSQKEDVDMVLVPNAQEDTESTVAAPTAIRAASVNMMRDEAAGDDSAESAPAADENSPVPDPRTDIPSIDFQVSTVTTLCRTEGEKQLEEGSSTYLVSKKWLERVTSRTSEARAKSKEALSDQDIGPIDNSNIIQRIIPQPGREDFVQLKHGIGEDFFELFPVDAWNMVFDWYGLKEDEKPIIRFAHNTNPDKTPDAIPNVTYEYHPPVFQIHRVWSELGNKVDAGTKSTNPDAPIIVASRSMRMHDFLKIIKNAAGVPMKQKIRLWRVPRTLPAAEPALSTAVGNATPPSSRPGTPPTADTGTASSEVQDSWKKLLLDVTEFTKVERDSGRIKVEFEDSTVNDNYNGRSDLDFCGLGDDQALVIDELVEGKDGYVSNTKPSQSGKLNGTGRKGNSSFIVSSQNNSGRNSPAPSSGYNLRSSNRRSKNGRPPGTVGLSNLGNTCYMNSALQCVRSVEELTKYFLSDAYDPELNRDNPLGHGGAVAESYANLLKEIYKEPAPVSVQPRYFKNIVGRYATQFSGYGQQDSQEFIGFLLDGLQEDLSRVKKKPYIEKPDSTDEMIGNPDAIREMATKVWDITKQRDDSVIADLFTGMYKSTLVCPECDKVSITFDPFNNMTLQLPIANVWSHDAVFYPLNDKPIAITIEIDKHASIRTLKTQISQKVGVPLERLFACEVWSNKFFRWHFDQETASDVIQTNDLLSVYELEVVPTNLPSPPKSKGNTFGGNNSDEAEHVSWDSPVAEKLLVPVFYRRRTREKWSSKKGSWELTTVPHFVVLTPQEARSEEVIKRKILEKVVTFTTSSIINDDDDPSSASESIDPDLVVTTGSDADSSGDSKFVAQSLDGEDEIIDVAMKDSNPVRESVENRSTAPLKIFNTSRPKWIDPAVFLSGEMQNLFEISYFTDKQGRLPLHWDDKLGDPTFKKISERNPQVHQMNSDDASYGFDLVDGSAGSVSSKSSRDSSDDINNFEMPPTRMNEESSEDDLNPTSPPKALPVRPAAPKSGGRVLHKSKRRHRNQATYTKKGKAAALKRQEIEADDEQEAPDDGPLIRPGEGLVVDWNEDAWDSLFGGSIDKNDAHGCPTYVNPPTLKDPGLLSTRKARISQKNTGIPLDDCLDEFGKEEILSEMDTWYCPRCKEHRRASKKFEIWRTPDILIMHLKRFSSVGYRRDKVDALVKFPIEGLDLSSRVVERQDGKDEIYDLIAIDDHWGGLGGGHYTAFAKNFVDGRWWSYNDASVDLVKNPSSMITSSAYLLFYRRRSSEPLGGAFMQEIVRTFDHNLSSDEEESGEGRRLGGNSSQPGSPSALTGVGAAHRQPDHPGSEDGVATMTANQPDLDNAPPYSEQTQDMSMGCNDVALTATQPIWGWGGLNQNPGTFPSGTGSEAGEAGSITGLSDGDSNGVLHGSEPSQASMERRREDFNTSEVDDEFQEEYIPDAVHDAPDAIQVMEYNRQRNYDLVSHVQQDEIEEPAAEIHLEDGEEHMLDGVRWWKISECIQWAGVIMVLILLMDGVGVEDVDDE